MEIILKRVWNQILENAVQNSQLPFGTFFDCIESVFKEISNDSLHEDVFFGALASVKYGKSIKAILAIILSAFFDRSPSIVDVANFVISFSAFNLGI